MQKTSRRRFLKAAGAGVAGVALRPWQALAGAGLAQNSLVVPGVHLYTSQQSVAAGQTMRFHVSSSVPYVLSVVRLGLQVDDPAGDEVLREFPQEMGAVQPIYPGSYVQIDKAIKGPLSALSLECWVRPWKLRRRGELMS